MAKEDLSTSVERETRDLIDYQPPRPAGATGDKLIRQLEREAAARRSAGKGR
jgi:hypothetical protein